LKKAVEQQLVSILWPEKPLGGAMPAILWWLKKHQQLVKLAFITLGLIAEKDDPKNFGIDLSFKTSTESH
jgi:hypothetical protein